MLILHSVIVLCIFCYLIAESQAFLKNLPALRPRNQQICAITERLSNSFEKKPFYGRKEANRDDSVATTSNTNSYQVTMTEGGVVTPKSITKGIMEHFSRSVYNKANDEIFAKQLQNEEILQNMDGLHIMTILFQCSRTKRLVKYILPSNIILEKLRAWNRMWSERDISTFVYGIRALECVDAIDTELLLLGAKKIKESTASLSSRAIGNSLYGLQDITSDTGGAAELCDALAEKIESYEGDLIGQDIGIGLYGLQGMSAQVAEVRKLIAILAKKIAKSDALFDAQAVANALYGLQSMSSDYVEVCQLVSALANKVADSKVEFSAQAIGSSLFGLQRLSSDHLEVRTLVAALAEKVDTSTVGLDAQAIGNALFGEFINDIK